MTMTDATAKRHVTHLIDQERVNQDAQWGIQTYHPYWWMLILMEEVGELSDNIIVHLAKNPLAPRTMESSPATICTIISGIAKVCTGILEAAVYSGQPLDADTPIATPPTGYLEELIQVAAVAQAALESIYRTHGDES